MITQEKIEVMKAYAEGKKIQYKPKANPTWADCIDEPLWNWEWTVYRIKPESTYRPYKDTEEMIEDFKKRFNVEVPQYAMPMIWVEHKRTNFRFFVSEFGVQVVAFCGVSRGMLELFDNYTYLDGSPCGMKED